MERARGPVSQRRSALLRQNGSKRALLTSEKIHSFLFYFVHSILFVCVCVLSRNDVTICDEAFNRKRAPRLRWRWKGEGLVTSPQSDLHVKVVDEILRRGLAPGIQFIPALWKYCANR